VCVCVRMCVCVYVYFWYISLMCFLTYAIVSAYDV
jgi:hypothetical protein